MSIDNFIPEIWTARLFEGLRKAHVFPGLVNTDYEGEVTQYGDTVRINEIGAITVRDYTKNNNHSAVDTLSDAQTVLEINQAKYFNFQIDDIDKAQQKPKLMDAAMSDAAYRLADEIDKFVASMHDQAHTTVQETTATADDVIPVLAEVGEKLNEANVPTLGRWLVVDPSFLSLMVQAEIISADNYASNIDAESTYRAGWVTRALGFDVYMSNNLEDDGTYTHLMAGTRRAITLAQQIASVEAYRPELRFADAVKGLYLYGGVVVDPNALVRVNIS